MTQDELTEILRKALNQLPRYSFVNDRNGAVRKVADRCGAFIEWQLVHAMLDPHAVDVLVASAAKQAEEAQ